jgi:hypothetical protein
VPKPKPEPLRWWQAARQPTPTPEMSVAEQARLDKQEVLVCCLKATVLFLALSVFWSVFSDDPQDGFIAQASFCVLAFMSVTVFLAPDLD